jgi:hypothetical protein
MARALQKEAQELVKITSDSLQLPAGGIGDNGEARPTKSQLEIDFNLLVDPRVDLVAVIRKNKVYEHDNL